MFQWKIRERLQELKLSGLLYTYGTKIGDDKGHYLSSCKRPHRKYHIRGVFKSSILNRSVFARSVLNRAVDLIYFPHSTLPNSTLFFLPTLGVSLVELGLGSECLCGLQQLRENWPQLSQLRHGAERVCKPQSSRYWKLLGDKCRKSKLADLIQHDCYNEIVQHG